MRDRTPAGYFVSDPADAHGVELSDASKTYDDKSAAAPSATMANTMGKGVAEEQDAHDL